jgi:hypothetical protein
MRDREDGVRVGPAKRRPVAATARGIEAIATIVEALELSVIVRHVRGHQPGDASTGQGRNFVNRTCDRLAKAGMKQRREQLRTQSLTSTETPQEAVTA